MSEQNVSMDSPQRKKSGSLRTTAYETTSHNNTEQMKRHDLQKNMLKNNSAS